MAKGDSTAPVGQAQQQPKIDQYSVMHKLMDAFGGNPPSVAPSPDMQMPNPVMAGGSMAPAPTQMLPQMGGRFGGGMGLPRSGGYNQGNPPPNVPMIGPSDPQAVLRNGMNGTRTFGQ
jgi:hypothetical protein